jgi:hypothetical protein
MIMEYESTGEGRCCQIQIVDEVESLKLNIYTALTLKLVRALYLTLTILIH